ncbi:ROK family protein, partial [bacterium]|nr:ROK family protein [bacterium]
FPKGEFPTPRRITQMVRDDNPKAKQIQLLMAARLTEAAATWVHMLNPQAIIIGGGTMAESDFFYAELNNRLRARARRVHTRDLRILSGKLGYYAGMLGASALWYSSQKE